MQDNKNIRQDIFWRSGLEGRFRFYIYGTTLELNGVPYEAGRLAEDILNMSREKYLARFDKMVEIQRLCDEYEESRDTVVWWKLNGIMYDLYLSLKDYVVFRHLLNEEEEYYFNTVMDVTGQLCLFPSVELPNPDDALERLAEQIGERLLSLNFLDEAPPPEIPWQEPEISLEEPLIPLLTHAMLLEHYGVNNTAWEEYKKVVDRFERYLLDTHAFIISIRNFIRLVLSRAKRNDAESYAESLYMYYNDGRLIQKLMVGPLQNYGVGYTLQDRYVLSYVPRLLPDDTAVIAQEHITDSIQAILKADYMLALNSGHQIRRCVICERFFLLKSGVHALYCEGACPHAPRFTCRQFGTHEVQKELAKDVPKVRAKLLSFERITKDMRRGNITREEARKAKDYVRDALYDALRDPNTTLESFEERVSSEHVYSACHIQRAGKPRGRPKKKAEGEA